MRRRRERDEGREVGANEGVGFLALFDHVVEEHQARSSPNIHGSHVLVGDDGNWGAMSNLPSCMGTVGIERRREEVRNGWPCEVASVLALFGKGRERKGRSTQDLKAHRGASL